MYIDNQVPIFVCQVLKTDIAQDTGIVDENIDTAVGLDSGFDDLVTIGDAVVVGNGLAACGYNLIDDYICGLVWLAGLITQLENERWKMKMHTFVEVPSPLKDPPRSLTTTLAPLDPKNVA